jgi:hypothetical protein
LLGDFVAADLREGFGCFQGVSNDFSGHYTVIFGALMISNDFMGFEMEIFQFISRCEGKVNMELNFFVSHGCVCACLYAILSHQGWRIGLQGLEIFMRHCDSDSIDASSRTSLGMLTRANVIANDDHNWWTLPGLIYL